LLLIGLEVLINVQSNFNKVPLSVTIDKDWRIVLTATVANKLRLLKLPQPIQEALLNKIITERHARALIPLKDPEKQVALLAEIIEKNFNVKQTEERVVKLLEQKNEKPKPKRKAFSKDMRIAVNTIRQSLSMVTDSGINLDAEEEEFEEFYQFTIRIPKKK